MKKHPTLLLTGLLALLAACAPSTTSPSTSTITPDLSSAIEKVMAETNVPGAIVGIWKGNAGDVRGFGVADRQTKQAMRPDMFVRIGSNTKSFTITALLRLVDQGRVGLDDPVAKYVPGVPNGENITLRQLAEMRSGLPDYTRSTAFLNDLVSNPTRQWTPAETLPLAFSRPALFPPGTFFNYSNTNTILIGLAIEAVTGRPLGDVVREQVIVPAGLKNTFWPKGSEFPAPHPSGYSEVTADGNEADATGWNPSWGWAAGSMVSTADDLHRWVGELTTGRLLSKESQAQRLKFVPILGNAGNVGYGLAVLDLNGWIGHNGDLPGFSSVMYKNPAHDLTLIVVTNTETQVDRDGISIPPAARLAEVITQSVLPDHPYRFPTLPEPPK